MGRYDDSIVQYRKALEIELNFVNAHQGIAMALLYSGKPGDAEKELAEFSRKARNDGERRTAMFARTVVHIDSGQTVKALADVDERYAVAQKNNDVAGMAFDRGVEGADPRGERKSRRRTEGIRRRISGHPGLEPLAGDQGQREARAPLQPLARCAGEKGLRRREEGGGRVPAGRGGRQEPVHRQERARVDGIIALAEKDWDKAIAELGQANPQNPQDIYRMCEAYRGKGDPAKAGELCVRAAEFNTLPNVNYTFIRVKAKAGAGKAAPEKKGV